MAAAESRASMRVAVLHDHLRFIGGGERVALTLASAFDADLYVTDLDPTLPERAGMPNVRAAEIARVPARPPMRQNAQARAFRNAEIPRHDLYILSGNWAVFAAPRCRPNLWYCHTPVRVFYDLRETFLASLPWMHRLAARRWIERRRPEYEAAIASVDRIVANSQNVANRIRNYLGQPSEVVYPPVDTTRYRFDRVGDFWLSVNRLSHEKRIGLQVNVFRRLPRERLVIVGGPQMGVSMEGFVSKLNPPPNVTFLGEVDDTRMRDLYATCRGLVATAQAEDFGLGPLEAMASGKAVVAVDEGGYRESVVPGATGWLLQADPEVLAAAIRQATPEVLEAMKENCRARASEFDTHRFVEGIRGLLAG
jgi:glycosyltransferase involved in cell wall biosynthesis